MANPSKFLHLGKSILFRSNRARSESKAVSSLLFFRAFNSSLQNNTTNAFIGFHRNGSQNFLPCCLGGFRAFSGEGGDEFEMKKGDWNCPECSFHNFARNVRCLKCKAKGPNQIGVSYAELKPGDWICQHCQYMNFARNTSCKCCREPSSVKPSTPGDWKCLECGFINFRRNRMCLKCEAISKEAADTL